MKKITFRRQLNIEDLYLPQTYGSIHRFFIDTRESFGVDIYLSINSYLESKEFGIIFMEQFPNIKPSG